MTMKSEKQKNDIYIDSNFPEPVKEFLNRAHLPELNAFERRERQGLVELWLYRITQDFCCDKCIKKTDAFIKKGKWKNDKTFYRSSGP